MSKHIDLNKYRYIMFVDASGDDGYKFKESSCDGSSFSFVVSCFVTTPDELEYNKSILLRMKAAMYVKPEQEIKSTALKRHKRAPFVYKEMKNLHGFSYSLIADKRLIKDNIPNPGEKYPELVLLAQYDLSGITHTFPYISLSSSKLLAQNDKVLIVIDNMKKREMDSIRSILANYSPEKYDLIFRDSKDKDFPLIQIADIFSGTIRTYYENCLPLAEHNRICHLCISSISHMKHFVPYSPMVKRCTIKKNKRLYTPYINNEPFNTVMFFHQHPKTDLSFGEHYIIIPIYQLLNFMYIDCLILKKGFKVH